MTRAIVFAYHNVGVRCLNVLLAHDVEIALTITHEDDPKENVWFSQVSSLCEGYDLPYLTPKKSELPALKAQLERLEPDFIFSFYYRHLIPPALLGTARRGALNMHGSLLPAYRGRAPVNWAILSGERETGASLHYMVARADAGDLVARQSVPILPNDTAHQVFEKVTWAAECLLDRQLPALLAGTAPRMPLDLAQGKYFGRRRPEDGQIDWSADAWAIHNLVRAVAPPYPGAFSDLGGRRYEFLQTRWWDQLARHSRVAIYVEEGRIWVDGADGHRFEVVELAVDGDPVVATDFARVCGAWAVFPGGI